MTAKIEPEGNRFEHLFDPLGRLESASDEEGGLWRFSRAVEPNGDFRSESLTAEGNLTAYLDHTDLNGAYTSRITDPNGAETFYSRSANGLNVEKSLPCGMSLSFQYDVDPRHWYKYVKQATQSTPSGLHKITLREKTHEDTDSNGVPDRITEKMTVNGKPTTFLTDTLNSVKVLTSPQGRSMSARYNPTTLLTEVLSVPGFHDTHYTYDTKGRLTSSAIGTRETTQAYDAMGNIASVTDPEAHTTSYTHDAVGRLTGVQRPDGSTLEFTYDGNGNMTVLTNPSSIDHGFGYNRVNLDSSYQTPLSGSYSYTYDGDRRLTHIHFPSGKEIRNVYDKTRLTQVQTPEGNIDLTYLCSTKVGSISREPNRSPMATTAPSSPARPCPGHSINFRENWGRC